MSDNSSSGYGGVLFIICVAILCRLGGCNNTDKNCIEQRLIRIEKLLTQKVVEIENTPMEVYTHEETTGIPSQEEYNW